MVVNKTAGQYTVRIEVLGGELDESKLKFIEAVANFTVATLIVPYDRFTLVMSGMCQLMARLTP